MKRLCTVFLLSLSLFLGCGDEEPEVTAPAICNPISNDHCMLPWPSTFYLSKDSSTKTGYRVNYPRKLMPENANFVRVDPARYNLLDGFSIGSQILVYFKSGVSAAGLPSRLDLANSVADKSPILILEYPTGARIPLFAELDANATKTTPGLIIRPQEPMKYNTRYVVVLRSELKDSDGKPLEPPEPFRRLRDGAGTSSPTLQGEQKRMEEVLSFLDRQKIARSGVVLAWDFHTASQELVTGNLVGMVKVAMSKLPATGPAFSSVKVTDLDEKAEPDLLRRIEGEMLVPSFLVSDAADAVLKLDAAGKPVYRGMQKVPFAIHIPRCVKKAGGPVPVLVFGHGLFGSTRDLGDDYNKTLHERLCMVAVNTPWWGLSSADVGPIAADVVTDFTNLPRVTDRIQQAHVNMHTLVKLMKGAFLQDASMRVDSKPVADGKELYYFGVSNGGIQGVGFAALNEDIERYVFNVSGGWWSMMMQRSSNFDLLAMLMENVYPDPVDRLILFSLTQHLWDYADPISFAGHVVTSPLPGHTAKKIILQESRFDDQVPNISTRGVVRGLGIDALSPAVEAVHGIPGKTGPLTSAYVQWDTDPKSKPKGNNTPAPKPKDEDSAHKAVRKLESFIKQVETFFKPGGQVVNTCKGPCDPE